MNIYIKITCLILILLGQNNINLFGQTFFISLEADPPEAAFSLTGEGSYQQGQLAEINTQPYEGWIFLHWIQNGIVVSEESNYSFIVTDNQTLTAVFESHVDLSADVDSIDFGEVVVGQCEMWEYLLRNNPPSEKQLVDLQIISPEGFQTVHLPSYPDIADFSDTTYHTFYIFYGEPFLARFCPTRSGEYSGNIAHIHTVADTLYLPVSGTGVIPLEVKIVLEGAYSSQAGQLMQPLLNQAGVLPLNQPFDPPLPYYGNPDPIWYYTGNESIQEMPEEAIDWVLIELRDAPSTQLATSESIVKQQAAILLEDGNIVNADGSPLLVDFDVGNNLFVVVYHRNHLPVMSSEPLGISSNTYSWDFTTGADQAYGSVQKQLSAGVYGLYGGDGDANGQIQNQDKNNVWQPQAGSTGYLPGDFNLNAQVQTQDKNNIWEQNGGIASQLPQAREYMPMEN